ncbi:MAG: CDP-diacylglycerol--glycerol-3-phosphate 3-phosphatidyltransferase [Clostridiales bacterium GWE2_32_10]|nr:MAG: CDP-diacylglycerol--glycerol-3-phosphate 3-phosphatidyltransferase [Clostridiales bacterium GWE2_32_10]HBY19440.1 CDP-diacylglycerol--glycerol-3-phosphate 3-phosphatidyltransferase [Clostridiales bacterium]
MNLANKISFLRILFIPIFLFFMYSDTEYGKYIGLGIFIVASLTDMLDGYIARKYNMITKLGKFLDPLADKILVLSAMIVFVENGALTSWVVIVIIFREFAITGFRIMAAADNVVIAASAWGKWKTVSHMAMVVILFFDLNSLNYIKDIFIYLAVILTLISGFDYVWKNKQIILNSQF